MPAFGNICPVWQEAAASGILVPHTMRQYRSGARGTNPCSFIVPCELDHVKGGKSGLGSLHVWSMSSSGTNAIAPTSA